MRGFDADSLDRSPEVARSSSSSRANASPSGTMTCFAGCGDSSAFRSAGDRSRRRDGQGRQPRHRPADRRGASRAESAAASARSSAHATSSRPAPGRSSPAPRSSRTAGPTSTSRSSLADAVGAEQVIAAVDSRGGHVVIHGWKTVLPVTAVDAVRALEPYCGEFLYTHVDAEGLMRGTELRRHSAPCAGTTRRVTAAGGITTQRGNRRARCRGRRLSGRHGHLHRSAPGRRTRRTLRCFLSNP